jgi:hypothetical protein
MLINVLIIGAAVYVVFGLGMWVGGARKTEMYEWVIKEGNRVMCEAIGRAGQECASRVARHIREIQEEEKEVREKERKAA